MFTTKTLILVIFSTIGFSNLSTAQSNLEGSLFHQNQPVLDATVSLTRTDGKGQRTIYVDRRNYFEFALIADGEYDLRVSHAGFDTLQVFRLSFPHDHGQVLGLLLEPKSDTSTETKTHGGPIAVKN